MSEFGYMGVDWEERVNFDRMRREGCKKPETPWINQGSMPCLFSPWKTCGTYRVPLLTWAR